MSKCLKTSFIRFCSVTNHYFDIGICCLNKNFLFFGATALFVCKKKREHRLKLNSFIRGVPLVFSKKKCNVTFPKECCPPLGMPRFLRLLTKRHLRTDRRLSAAFCLFINTAINVDRTGSLFVNGGIRLEDMCL